MSQLEELIIHSLIIRIKASDWRGVIIEASGQVENR